MKLEKRYENGYTKDGIAREFLSRTHSGDGKSYLF